MPLLRKPAPIRYSAVVAGEVYLKDLPEEVLREIKQDLTLLNPLYASTEKFGSKFNLKTIPKTIGYYRQPAHNVISVPRGYQVKGVRLNEAINVVSPPATYPTPLLTPRASQAAVLKVWGSAKTRRYWDGTIVAPPAEGKTITGLFVAEKMKLRTLVIVHKDTILAAWKSDILKMFGPDFKYEVWKGKKSVKNDPDTTLVIASAQTLKNLDADKWSESFGLVVVDECHRSASHTIYTLLENCHAAYRVGLTATPEREDGLDRVILLACGPVRIKIEKSERETVPIEIIRIATPFKVSKPAENPDSLRQHTIWKRQSSNKKRIQSILDLIHFIDHHSKLKAPILILANHIEVCAELAKITGGFHFHSKLKADERSQFMDDARAGKIKVTVATPSMMGEGVNVPPWTHLILTNSFTAKTLVRQTCGRVERKSGNKTKGYVWDFVDDCPRVIKQFKYRKNTYMLNKFNIRYMRFVFNTDKNRWVLREKRRA